MLKLRELYLSKLQLRQINMEHQLSHFDEEGNAIMVDVTEKSETMREAVARGQIKVSPEILERVRKGTVEKGDVLGVARIAGIMAAKRTGELIPLCHPLMISGIHLEFTCMEEETAIEAVCHVKLSGKTGVEMEALTGVSIALLTIYDMCKALDKSMVIQDICLVSKQGGKSGTFYRIPDTTGR